jgi:CheY-like chemotaxis protein
MKVLLELRGPDVELASNGQEGVEGHAHLAQTWVLMDMKMPDMDGGWVRRAIREDDARTQ